MWPKSSDTQELIAAAREGNGAAVDALLERHRAAVRKLIALRMDRGLQRRVDASDIVQEALVEANRRLPTYLSDNPLPFHLWLRQIAHDRLIDAHRRHRGAARRSVEREQPVAQSSCGDRSAFDLAAQLRDHREATPAAALLRKELDLRMREALAMLDEPDREVIELRHIEQLSNQETALALGLSEPAAGMRYLRALRRLRALLDEPPSAESR